MLKYPPQRKHLPIRFTLLDIVTSILGRSIDDIVGPTCLVGVYGLQCSWEREMKGSMKGMCDEFGCQKHVVVGDQEFFSWGGWCPPGVPGLLQMTLNSWSSSPQQI